MQGEAGTGKIMLHKPAAGQTAKVAMRPGLVYMLDFSPDNASFDQDNSDVRVAFEDGAVLSLGGFLSVTVQDDFILELPDGTQISGKDLAEAIVMVLQDFRTNSIDSPAASGELHPVPEAPEHEQAVAAAPLLYNVSEDHPSESLTSLLDPDGHEYGPTCSLACDLPVGHAFLELQEPLEETERGPVFGKSAPSAHYTGGAYDAPFFPEAEPDRRSADHGAFQPEAPPRLLILDHDQADISDSSSWNPLDSGLAPVFIPAARAHENQPLSPSFIFPCVSGNGDEEDLKLEDVLDTSQFISFETSFLHPSFEALLKDPRIEEAAAAVDAMRQDSELFFLPYWSDGSSDTLDPLLLAFFRMSS